MIAGADALRSAATPGSGRSRRRVPPGHRRTAPSSRTATIASVPAPGRRPRPAGSRRNPAWPTGSSGRPGASHHERLRARRRGRRPRHIHARPGPRSHPGGPRTTRAVRSSPALPARRQNWAISESESPWLPQQLPMSAIDIPVRGTARFRYRNDGPRPPRERRARAAHILDALKFHVGPVLGFEQDAIATRDRPHVGTGRHHLRPRQPFADLSGGGDQDPAGGVRSPSGPSPRTRTRSCSNLIGSGSSGSVIQRSAARAPAHVRRGP